MLRKTLLMLLLAASSAAFAADLVAKHGDDYVRLTQEACPAETAAMVPVELSSQLHRAYAVINHHEYAGCWLLIETNVVIQYDDTDRGVIDVGAFKADYGV